MSRLNKYQASRFKGSIDQARGIKEKCDAAIELLQSVEDLYAKMGREEHREIRRELAAASLDICLCVLEPIEAKFPELKKNA